MNNTNYSLKSKVEELVAQIPRGRVMSYGQIAMLCGQPRAARIVGGIAHFGNQNLPWQRVVHKDGRLAIGFPGGVRGHKQVLEQEGIKVSKDFKVDIDSLIWTPDL